MTRLAHIVRFLFTVLWLLVMSWGFLGWWMIGEAYAGWRWVCELIVDCVRSSKPVRAK